MKHATTILRITVLITLLLGLVSIQPVTAGNLSPQATIQVTIESDEYNTSGSGTGCSLREAIQSANTNSAFGGCETGSGADIITFQDNLDLITLSIDPVDDASNATGDLNIESDLTIQGPRWQDLTIDAGDNLSRIFEISNTEVDLTVTIKGVALINGNPGTNLNGGAILNTESLVLDGVALADNHADYSGGAVYSSPQGSNAILTIRNSLFSNNSSEHVGGAIASSAVLYLENNLIYYNVAKNSVFGSGGGLFSSGVPATILRTNFHHNQSGSHGGNLYLEGPVGTILIEDSIINEGVTEYGDGGNIYATNRSDYELHVIIRRTEISDGHAGDNMDPDQLGGGIYSDAGLVLENVTISGNFAPLGGGIYWAEDIWPSSFKNITVTDNSHSDTLGAGIYKDGAGLMQITNSIVAMNNLPDTCGGHYCDCYTPGPISSGYNLERGDSCSFGQASDQQSTNPLMGPLSTNWGSSRTHALYLGSPAIDHGNNATCMSTDQRGWYRPVDGPDADTTATCDIGAFEFGHRLVFLPLIIR
jgi:CSLREA domain-containing protein